MFLTNESNTLLTSYGLLIQEKVSELTVYSLDSKSENTSPLKSSQNEYLLDMSEHLFLSSNFIEVIVTFEMTSGKRPYLFLLAAFNIIVFTLIFFHHVQQPYDSTMVSSWKHCDFNVLVQSSEEKLRHT